MNPQRCEYMLNRPALFLIVSINIKKEKHFRLFLPLPVFLVYSFTEMILDIMDFAALFVPKNARTIKGKHSSVSFQTVHSGMTCAHLVVKDIFSIKAPWELCSVDADGVKIRIKFY